MNPIIKRVTSFMILLFFCIFLLPLGANAASPIFVRQNGSDTNCNGLFPFSEAQGVGEDCAFRTITHGIEEVSSGGEVRVISGTFDESVVLNRDVFVKFSGATTINGNLSIQNGEFDSPAPSFNLTGNFTLSNTGVFSHTLSTIILNGIAPQTIAGTQAPFLNNLTINNPANVFLENEVYLAGTMNLLNGNVVLNDHNLVFSPQSAVVGTFTSNNMIVTNGAGKICKKFPNNYAGPWPTSTFTFPIGDQTGAVDYSPASISLSSGFFGNAPSVCMGVVDARMPQNYFPIHITRYWLAETRSISSFSANLSFQYVQDDVVGDEAELISLSQSGVSWRFGSTADPTANTFTVMDENLAAFTAGGNVLPIDLDSIVSVSEPSSVRLSWRTTSETGILGFNIFRSENLVIPGVPINPVQISAQNSCTPSIPCFYEYVDNTPTFGVFYNYWLSVLGAVPDQEFFGPITEGVFLHLFLPVIRR